jgi:hypothetical protein
MFLIALLLLISTVPATAHAGEMTCFANVCEAVETPQVTPSIPDHICYGESCQKTRITYAQCNDKGCSYAYSDDKKPHFIVYPDGKTEWIGG